MVESFSPMPTPATGRFIGVEHYFPLRVYFEDTDLTGVVYHPNYLKYMERARTDMLLCLGIDHRNAIDAGIGYYVVSGVEIQYRRPARLDESLMVVSKVLETKAASWIIQQIVMRGDEALSKAIIRVGFVSPEGRPKRQPAEWLSVYRHMLKED